MALTKTLIRNIYQQRFARKHYTEKLRLETTEIV